MKFDSNPESRLGAHHGCRNGDQGERADRLEKILQRLSALEQATCAVSGPGAFPPPSGNDRTNHEQPHSDKPGRFLLVDRTGPIAEFLSWNAARQYMSAQQHHGASIISVVEPEERGPTLL